MLDIILMGASKGLLLLLGTNLLPDDDLEKWLKEDNFEGHPEQNASKKYLFDELNRLKDRLRKDMSDKGIIKDEKGDNLTPIGIYNLVQGHKNRIDKVRLIIQNDFSILFHTHKPSGVKYVVARAYWLDKQGKKFRKFSKNLGPEEKVKLNGRIPDRMLQGVAKEFEDMMWNEYLFEYPND